MYVYVLTVCLLSKPACNRYACFLFSIGKCVENWKSPLRHARLSIRLFDGRIGSGICYLCLIADFFNSLTFYLFCYSKCKLQCMIFWQYRDYFLWSPIKSYIFYYLWHVNFLSYTFNQIFLLSLYENLNSKKVYTAKNYYHPLPNIASNQNVIISEDWVEFFTFHKNARLRFYGRKIVIRLIGLQSRRKDSGMRDLARI